MKKMVCLLVIMVLLGPLAPAQAAPPDYAGGVNNEYEYQEVVFLSGQPVLFKGTFSISQKGSAEKGTVSYKFDLKPADPALKGSLDRRVSYETAYTKFAAQGQTTGTTEVKSYRETVVLGADRYTLSDYQLSRSDVIDNRPASDFSSGTVAARKVYQINKNQGTVVVSISGGTVGYSNFWGRTKTQALDCYLQAQRLPITSKDKQTDAVSWSGTARVMASDSLRKSLNYAANEVSLSSFPGGHMTVANQEMVSNYKFDLPRIVNGVVQDYGRESGEIQLRQAMLPQIERLILPKFRDLGGHWAEEDIKKLYSLNVFQGDSPFFLPDAPMTRLDFIRAVMRACNIQMEPTPKTGLSRTRRAAPEAALVKDVPSTHPDYEYVKEAILKGLVQGSEGYFLPASSLTRAQAVTILVRGLGFEFNAPAPGFFSQFRDDAEIPPWARDSVYMARQIGLLTGDSSNRAFPNQVMSRAEASAMLIRFLNFLERDLHQDYRENILLYK